MKHMSTWYDIYTGGWIQQTTRRCVGKGWVFKACQNDACESKWRRLYGRSLQTERPTRENIKFFKLFFRQNLLEAERWILRNRELTTLSCRIAPSGPRIAVHVNTAVYDKRPWFLCVLVQAVHLRAHIYSHTRLERSGSAQKQRKAL